jgi:hypothetical protein
MQPQLSCPQPYSVATIAFNRLSEPPQHNLLHAVQPYSAPMPEQPPSDHSLSQQGWGGPEHGNNVCSRIHVTAQGGAWYYTYPIQPHSLGTRNLWATYLIQPPPAITPPCHHCSADRVTFPRQVSGNSIEMVVRMSFSVTGSKTDGGGKEGVGMRCKRVANAFGTRHALPHSSATIHLATIAKHI